MNTCKYSVLVPILFIGLLILPTSLQAQDPCSISISHDTVNFGTAYPYEEKIQSIIVTNTSGSVITLASLQIVSRFSVFSVMDFTRNVLSPGQSLTLNLAFKTSQNISYQATALITVECDMLRYSKSFFLQGKAIYPNQEFAFTENLEGQALYNALNNYVNGSTVYSYYDARNHMFSKADNIGGYVECIYTGKKIQTSTIPDPNIFNTEHSWPQSKGADKEPARTDIYHIYPTDAKANEKRSNNPFGVVARSISWELGGSKLGLPQLSSDTTFEPRDVSKGNIARSLFYFATRYGNRKGTYDTDGFLTKMENTLREWNKKDPVDERERSRGESIASVQKRKNPFIEFPEIIDRFYKLSTQPDFPLYPEPSTDPLGIMAIVQPLDSIDIIVPIINKGNQLLTITSTEFRPATSQAQVIRIDSTIPYGTCRTITVRMKQNIPSGTLLRVRFADGISTLPIPVSSEKTISSIHDNMPSFESSLYPNPGINGSSQILNIKTTHRNGIKIAVYDIHGTMIADLSNTIDWNSHIGTVIIPDYISRLSSTVFCTVHSQNSIKTHVLLPVQ